MTRPSTRACRQTNSSEGGFVRKVPFLFFYLINFSFLFFYSYVFSLFPIFSVIHCQLEGQPDYTGEIGCSFLGYLF